MALLLFFIEWIASDKKEEEEGRHTFYLSAAFLHIWFTTFLFQELWNGNNTLSVLAQHWDRRGDFAAAKGTRLLALHAIKHSGHLAKKEDAKACALWLFFPTNFSLRTTQSCNRYPIACLWALYPFFLGSFKQEENCIFHSKPANLGFIPTMMEQKTKTCT